MPKRARELFENLKGRKPTPGLSDDAKDPSVTFNGREFKLSICWYVGAPHLTLLLADAKSGEHAHWASAVFAHEASLKPNEVLVHDWGKTSGMLRALEEAGVVRATGATGRWHGLNLPVAELLVEPRAELKAQLQEQEQARARGALGAWLDAQSRRFWEQLSEPAAAPEKQQDRGGREM